MVPLSVNFMALVTKLINIYFSLFLSVNMPNGQVFENVRLSFIPLLEDYNMNMSRTSSIIFFRVNFSSFVESLPFLSIYMSSMSFTKAKRNYAEILMILVVFKDWSLSLWNSSRRSNCISIELIGVLISWLTVARSISYCSFSNLAN